MQIIGTRKLAQIIELIGAGSIDMQGLLVRCVTLLAMYLCNSLAIYAQGRMMNKVSQVTSAKLRGDLFSKVQKLPLKYYDSHQSGDLMSRLTNDVDNINTSLSQTVTQIFTSVTSIIGYLIAMFVTDWKLSLIGLITTPILLVMLRAVLKISQPIFVKQQRYLGGMNGYIEESISGQRAVILFSRQEKNKEEFAAHNRSFTRSAIASAAISGIMGPTHNMMNNFVYLVVCVAGGYFAINSYTGDVDLAVYAANYAALIYTFVVYLRNFNRPVNDIFNLMNTLQQAFAGAERVFEVMDEQPETDPPSARNVDSSNGNVEIEHVYFSYDGKKTVLKDISISAPQGSTIAIVGHTGAGKTTIVNLLSKFYDFSQGVITIDGKDIREITMYSMRNMLSIVLQDTFLFGVSIKENIRYSRPTATDEEIVEAARLANAHYFISALPQGYDTILEDNGSNLSQGQRQLLAIARAILADCSILILDEATSSIDTKTEVEIQQAMLALMKGKTSFVIAHRLSTIKNADQILMLDDGVIVERGTHDELLAKNGAYAELYKSQFLNVTE